MVKRGPIELEELARAIPKRRRERHGRRRAAVALIARAGQADVELLFIVRPRRDGDRWSGHVAFPGGLAHPGEQSAEVTARREALEEVGLRLGPAVGLLDDVVTGEPGALRPMPVTPVVFLAQPDVVIRPDPREVAEVMWVPVARLRQAPRGRMWRKVLGVPFPFATVDVYGHTLWGLTLQMVDGLGARL